MPHTDVSSPAPLLLPNGSVLLGYSAGGDGLGGDGIGAAVAPSWRGPYARVGPSVSGPLFAAKDGAMYRDCHGHFHMLVHRFAPEDCRPFCGDDISIHQFGQGGHAWSLDGLEWHYDNQSVAYTSNVTWVDGQGGNLPWKSLYRRERPRPVLGEGGRILHLFNGAWPCHKGTNDSDDSRDGAMGCASFTMTTRVM